MNARVFAVTQVGDDAIVTLCPGETDRRGKCAHTIGHIEMPFPLEEYKRDSRGVKSRALERARATFSATRRNLS